MNMNLYNLVSLEGSKSREGEREREKAVNFDNE